MADSYTMEEWRQQIAAAKEQNRRLAQQAAVAAAAVEAQPVEAPAEQAAPEPVVEQPAEVVAEETAAPAEVPAEAPTAPAEPAPAEEKVVTAPEPVASEEKLVVETKPAPVAEAPEIKTVVEEVSEEQLMANLKAMGTNKPSKKKANKTSDVERKFTVACLDEGDRIDFRPIHNPALLKFANEVYRNNTIPEELTIPCERVRRNRSQELGIWEEGGSHNSQGTVLLVTDGLGRPKSAITGYHSRNKCNGKHAFITINEGDHILIGARKNDTYALCLMRLTDFVISQDPNGECTAKAICVASNDNLKDSAGDTLDISAGKLNDEERIWIPEADSSSDLVNILFEKGSTVLRSERVTNPIYVQKYTHRYNIDKVDYDDAVSNDAKYAAKMKIYKSLDDLYGDLDGVFDNYFANTAMSGELPLVIINLSFETTLKTGKEVVMAHVHGLVYNKAENSSRGNRLFYGAIPVYADTGFYSPNNPNKVYSKEHIAKWLVTRNSKDKDGKWNPKIWSLVRMM